MEMNWMLMGIIFLVGVVVIFTIIRNWKNKKEYTKYLNKNYPKTEEENSEDQY